jgi:hypothetical protein
MRHLLTILAALLAAPALAQSVVLYSRADTAQALHAQRLAAVFGPALMDLQMVPGVDWREAMAGAICTAPVVLLIWSARARASAEVEREVHTAMQCRRLIVPVLLDDTPLPGLVADTQAVDWR